MRYSNYFIPTLKDDPSDAEVASHKLMIRGGMIRKLAAGIYSYLPLGLRSIGKVEQIVREEMNRAGAVELLMPAVLPSELWEESGRWDYYGKELLRFKDRADREFCIGPTHEEIITDIVRRDISSYKQLPVNLYQIQTKFRDEIRPRFGVMRAREFIMKDAYSFDATVEGAEKSYWAMYEAYTRIFERCGLEFRAVLADTGNIGGNFSHEFMVLAPTGEDIIMSCDKCDYAANLELAEIGGQNSTEMSQNDAEKAIEEIHTPNLKSVEEVAQQLNVTPSNLIKTMIVVVDGNLIAALVRGDHELSLTKLRKALGAELVELAMPDQIVEATGGPMGFSGPVGLNIRKAADISVKNMGTSVTGANKADYHIINVTYGNDYEVDEFYDIRVASDGDKCPKCDGTLTSTRGIEVGHVFMLGTKYSEAMNATFVDSEGKEKPFIMGCYGIGIGRTVAAAIEQNHDENGMIFPKALAPFEITVLPLKIKDEQIMAESERIYSELIEAGYEAIIDDRDVGPGFKFKDAELIGVPIIVAVGPRTIKDEEAEVKVRKTGDSRNIKLEVIVKKIKELLDSI